MAAETSFANRPTNFAPIITIHFLRVAPGARAVFRLITIEYILAKGPVDSAVVVGIMAENVLAKYSQRYLPLGAVVIKGLAGGRDWLGAGVAGDN